jgi:hypothetical protein
MKQEQRIKSWSLLYKDYSLSSCIFLDFVKMDIVMIMCQDLHHGILYGAGFGRWYKGMFRGHIEVLVFGF